MTNETFVLTAARGQSYGREQGESPPFISAAAATGSPIIAPGVGTFPPQPVYQIPSHQPVAYVQSPAGMVPSPQQMMQQVGNMFCLSFTLQLALEK